MSLLLRHFGFLEGLERVSYDGRFRLRGERPVSDALVLVGIDEQSIKRFGRWPWDRSVHGLLIRRLKEAGAKTVAFDVIFSEPQDRPGADADLVAATRAHGQVIHEGFVEFREAEGGREPIVRPPFSALASAAAGMGIPNIFPDPDGVLRDVPLFLAQEKTGRAIPHIAVAAVSRFLDVPVEALIQKMPVQPRELSDIPGTVIYLLRVNFAGSSASIPYLSAVDVAEGRVDPARLKGKLVWIGFKAAGLGLQDKIVTPFKHVDPYVPGVECLVHASDTLLKQNAIRPADPWLGHLASAAMGVLLGGVLPRLGALGSAGLMLLLGFLYSAAVQLAFVRGNIWAEWAAPSVALGTAYLGISGYRFFAEQKEKRWIQQTFSQYLSPKVIAVLQQNPEKMNLGGETREMTVFFSDLAGFTSVSEALPPETLTSLLNEYLTEMSEIILKHDGVIDKYMGDGVMAFWNAPLDQPDHASRACLAALEQRERLAALNRSLAERGLPKLSFRAGIHTGVMKVGNFGSRSRFDYTVMGDAVNLGSRLEGANKAFHTEIMISEATWEKAKDRVIVRELDRIRVKGKAKPIRVYELLAPRLSADGLPEEWRDLLPVYEEGIWFYQERRFEEAAEKFREVLRLRPEDGPAQVYLERCTAYRSAPPPPDWDGVFVLTTK